MRTELKEQTEFIKLLKRNGWKAYKVSSPEAGVPDIEGIFDNTIYKFEQKVAKGSYLSPQQKKYFTFYTRCFVVKKIKGIFYYYGKTEIPLLIQETKIKYGGDHEIFTT